MSKLQITARFKIHDGRLNEFKRLAEQCISIVKEKDQRTLQFDWFLDQHGTECVLREAYPDSDALLSHLGNIGELFGELRTLGDFSAEVYGKPSEALMNATNGLDLRIYSFYQGLGDRGDVNLRNQAVQAP